MNFFSEEKLKLKNLKPLSPVFKSNKNLVSAPLS